MSLLSSNFCSLVWTMILWLLAWHVSGAKHNVCVCNNATCSLHVDAVYHFVGVCTVHCVKGRYLRILKISQQFYYGRRHIVVRPQTSVEIGKSFQCWRILKSNFPLEKWYDVVVIVSNICNTRNRYQNRKRKNYDLHFVMRTIDEYIPET